MSKKIANIARLGISCLKNSDNPYFNSKYADLGAVVDALKEPLEKEGLGYYFSILNVTPNPTGDGWSWQVIITVTDLETGKTEGTSAFPITCLEPQKFGSNVTYAKRYLLTTVFNVIAEEDDDGNATTTKPNVKREPKVLNKAQDFFN